MNQDPKQNRPGHGNQNEPDHSKRTKSILIMVVVALAFTIIINLVYTSIANSYLKQITFTEFQTLLDEGKVDSVDIDTDRFLILTKDEARGQADHLLHRPSHQHGSLAADGGDD